MTNLGIILSTMSEMVSNKSMEIKVIEGTKLFKCLDFFFEHGNNGINALRELLEEANDDLVDVYFENNGDNFETYISVCFEYHTIKIIKIYDTSKKSKSTYKIVDSSRKDIEAIKQEFKLTTFY